MKDVTSDGMAERRGLPSESTEGLKAQTEFRRNVT